MSSTAHKLSEFYSAQGPVGAYAVLAITALAATVLYAAAAMAAPPSHQMIMADQLRWEPAKSLPPGAQQAVLYGVPSQPGPFIVRFKLPANYLLPAHWHPGVEHVTVLSGVFNMGIGGRFDKTRTKPAKVGDVVIIQPKIHHFGWTKKAIVVQLHGVGPWDINYLNPADDPRLTQN